MCTTKHILEQLRDWENLIANNKAKFQARFCNNDELLSLSFNSETIYIHHLTKAGAHIGNSFPMREFLDFLLTCEQH